MTHHQERIQAAFDFAAIHHSGQFRKGYFSQAYIPYIAHPLDVMRRVQGWGFTDNHLDVLVVALLHDVLEDTKADKAGTLIDIRFRFGGVVAKCVEELTYTGKTKVGKATYMKSFADKSIISYVVKVADRLCNTNDFQVIDPAYAWEYLKKANHLLKGFDGLPKHVVAAQFGGTIAAAIVDDIYNTTRYYSLDGLPPL
jgi:(p)ppGpp synthase/HD superfamily hydrolase